MLVSSSKAFRTGEEISVISAGNANLPTGVLQVANREIGVPGLPASGLCQGVLRPVARFLQIPIEPYISCSPFIKVEFNLRVAPSHLRPAASFARHSTCCDGRVCCLLERPGTSESTSARATHYRAPAGNGRWFAGYTGRA